MKSFLTQQVFTRRLHAMLKQVKQSLIYYRSKEIAEQKLFTCYTSMEAFFGVQMHAQITLDIARVGQRLLKIDNQAGDNIPIYSIFVVLHNCGALSE